MILSYYERVFCKDMSDQIPGRFYSEHGSRFQRNFHGVIRKDGVLDLVEDEPTDLYAQIQTHRDSCDINLIVQRFKAGDDSVLDRRKGFFADVSELPDSYAGFLNIHQQACDIFDTLSIDDRAKFDNDVNKFIASFGSQSFDDVFKARLGTDSGNSVAPIESGEPKGVDVSE